MSRPQIRLGCMRQNPSTQAHLVEEPIAPGYEVATVEKPRQIREAVWVDAARISAGFRMQQNVRDQSQPY